MWIEPNGIVKILNGVPLDENYNNTLHFAGRIAQYNYFNSMTKYTYNKVSYQRIKRNYIRVEINAENLYDCNYLMFQNTSFGNRWFYAFITNVEYLSNMVSQIEYVIDEIQTWLLDCTIKDSFVEREHSLTDEVGANRVEENIEHGEFVLEALRESRDENNYPYFQDQVIVMAVTETPAQHGFNRVGMRMYQGIASSLSYLTFGTTHEEIIRARTIIDGYVSSGKKDAIISIFQCPEIFFENPDTDSTTPYSFTYGMDKPTTIDGYTPRNKKLLQYPYNSLFVTDCRGNYHNYNYEDFMQQRVLFSYALAGSCDPSMVIIPIGYKGVAGYNHNEQMVYKGYPQVSWNTDMWQAYMAQNGGVIPTLMKDFVSPIAGGIAGSSLVENTATRKEFSEKTIYSDDEIAIGRATGHITIWAQVISAMGRLNQHMRQPASASGNYNADIIYGFSMRDFFYGQMTIRREFAERIDKYFDMFGYATNMVKQPNLSSRPHWNYVKVIDMNIFGNIPADSLQSIKAIFHNGITFWKNASEVGNYSLNNQPV